MAYRSGTTEWEGFFAIGLILLWVAAAIGWILNIVKIVGSVADPLSAMFIIRCLGVFLAPVGAILGFL